MKIYKTTEVGMYGEETKPIYFRSLDDAQTEFEKKMNQIQKENRVVDNRDLDVLAIGEKPVEIRTKQEEMLHSSALQEGIINFWYRCSHEDDEWDVTFTSVVIEEIEVL